MLASRWFAANWRPEGQAKVESFHNPDRFASDLRQILSQGRKRIGLLVGAGAPLAVRVSASGKLDENGTPLIPGVEGLTAAALENLTGVYAAAAAAIRGELGGASNIEQVLSRVRLLQTVIGKTQVHGLDGEGYAQLSKSICDAIGAVVNVVLPGERNAYTELVAWISGTVRPHPVEIFTTNYDLLFEEAFERARAPYFDGFTGGSAPFFDPVTVAGDDLPPRWSRVWKLHGSIGWAVESHGIVRGGGRGATQLVYPDHLKYDLTQKQPYAAMFERLKRFLLTPDTLLLAIGFSFRDSHVCAALDESLAMNANSSVFAFQYQDLSAEAPAGQLALVRPNLSVYAADGAIISGVSGQWRLGDLPKNWNDIRDSFWGARSGSTRNSFLLGDFQRFARFCALTQATDLRQTQAKLDGDPIEINAPAAGTE